MNCPRCNAIVAFKKNQCDNCGQDLQIYRRIVSQSNQYYNQALSQAKVRDLSGAIHSLKQSLQFNKLNINARNLLGLVYYETGEIVSALSEWVISKNYQDRGNDADLYIRAIQANPNKLELYNQTIKKYNVALQAAQSGDEDMAIIQLKKVVSLNPKFVRASQLLALLYMMSGKRENRARAYRLMQNASKIDATNTTTLRYLQELSDMRGKTDPAVKIERTTQESVRKVAAASSSSEADAYRTITPYREERPSVMPLVNIMIGMILGLAVMYFLVIPHIRSSDTAEANKKFQQYSEDQAASDGDVSTLKNQNETLQARVDELTAQLTELQGGDSSDLTSIQDNYDALLDAYNSFQKGDKEEAAEKLSAINIDKISSDVAKEFYETIKGDTFAEASEKAFTQGRDAYNGEGEYSGHRDYEKAIELLEQALEYNKDNTDAMYFLGRCYQQKSDAERAKEYYNQIINDYPDSHRVSEANRRLRELGE